MSSNYKGLYVICSDSEVTAVQVQATGGNSFPLPLNVYQDRGVQPELCSLPTEDEYRSQNSKHILDNARKKAQEAADKYQRLVCYQNDILSNLQRSEWKDTDAMSRIDALVSPIEKARSVFCQRSKEYYDAGGWEPILVMPKCENRQ